MLKNIPKNVSADLIKILMDMGHGDEIVIGDGNFPAWVRPKNVVSCIGMGTAEMLDSILSLIPLDTFVPHPTTFMQVVGEQDSKPPIWNEYESIGLKHEEQGLRWEAIDRFEFYERAKNAYAIITTSELSLYACLILKKGVF